MSATLVGAVEYGQMLIFEMRRTFNGHSAADVFAGFVDLNFGKAEFSEQIEAGGVVLLRSVAQALHQCFAENPGCEGEFQFKDAWQRAFRLFQIHRAESLRH